jgi:hypothetical protein
MLGLPKYLAKIKILTHIIDHYYGRRILQVGTVGILYYSGARQYSWKEYHI